MKILILSDIHGDYNRTKQYIEKFSPEVVLCCGDVTTTYGKDCGIPSFDIPFYFIPGNHECPELELYEHDFKKHLETPQKLRNNVFFLPRPSLLALPPSIYVAGLGGNYSVKDWNKLVTNKWHYSEHMFNKLNGLVRILGKVDILLTHESGCETRGNRTIPPRPEIVELVKKIQPRYHFSGHLHHSAQCKIGNTISITLPQPKVGGILLETDTWEFKRICLGDD